MYTVAPRPSVNDGGLRNASNRLMSFGVPLVSYRAIASGQADLIAFGRPYLSNPDLVERFANGWELNPPADMKAWSAPTAAGYTDFPFHAGS